MDPLLEQLAEKLGIVTHFSDAGLVRREYEADEQTVKFFIKKFGYKAGNIQEIAKSLDDLDKKRWQKTLDSVYVRNQRDIYFEAIVPASCKKNGFLINLTNQLTGSKIAPAFSIYPQNEESIIGKTTYQKIVFVIDMLLDVGYYDMTLSFNGKSYNTVVAVAPDKCYQNKFVADKKLWGYTVQLYSIKSKRNWGIGDFTDLCEIVKLCSRTGADAIGLNPLNVLQHNYPEEASPYSSINRLFLNPIYIDIEAVPEFKKSDKSTSLCKTLEHLRKSDVIDYTSVYDLKTIHLKNLYTRFMQEDNKKRKADFNKFCKEKGEDLDRLAIFQSIYDDKTGEVWGGWQAWEEDLKNPNSLAIKKYAAENQAKVNFFKFLQFEAYRQLHKAYDLVKKSGLKIGFYQDLAVGVGKDSAELWGDTELFIKDAGTGAPPDAFFPCGQKWGLGTFNPYVLRERAYIPFRKILRENMAYSGALRIDHVMSLLRLYVIPDNQQSGTYIYYNFDEMLDIVAIESYLNECMVVGESIGNVPPGFLEKIASKNIYSLSILWAERLEMGWGDFKSPSDYPKNAFVSVGTHDIAPLKMWWFGYDIAKARTLNMIENDDQMREAYQKREIDRAKLLFAMDSNDAWPYDNLRKGDYPYGESYPEGLEEAVNRFVSRSSCPVFLSQLEDIFHVDKLQNLPGTDRDKHPNWRQKLPVDLEDFENNTLFTRNLVSIKSER